MDTGLIIDILISIFAVFGVCSLVKLMVQTLFNANRYSVAIICGKETGSDEIVSLINQARTMWHSIGAGRIVLLLEPGVTLPPELSLAMWEHNIKIYGITEYTPYACKGLKTITEKENVNEHNTEL